MTAAGAALDWARAAARPSSADGRRLDHLGAWAVVAAVAFGASLLVALQHPVPGWELRLTAWINDAPDLVADVLYPLMQLGTVVAPLGIALAILILRRDWSSAAATVAVGLVAWLGAKAVKRWVERGRPLRYLPEINVREGSGEGLGFISGHSAVVAAVAVMAITALPRRASPGRC